MFSYSNCLKNIFYWIHCQKERWWHYIISAFFQILILKNLVKHVKVISGEEVVSLHRKKKIYKGEKQPLIPESRVWKLNERDVNENFANNLETVTQRVNVENHVED